MSCLLAWVIRTRKNEMEYDIDPLGNLGPLLGPLLGRLLGPLIGHLLGPAGTYGSF